MLEQQSMQKKEQDKIAIGSEGTESMIKKTDKKQSLPKKVGYVGLIGRPNVGKSTLLNQIIGEKLSIASSHPQTTRTRLLGIKHLDDAQIMFVDTPGLYNEGGPGKTLLNRFMMEETKYALSEVEVLVFLMDAPSLIKILEKVLEQRGQATLRDIFSEEEIYAIKELVHPKKRLAVLNKIDLISDKRRLLPLLKYLTETGLFLQSIPLSAQTGDGVSQLIEEIKQILPDGEPLFEEEMITDRDERFLVAEKIREQVFLSTYEEVPYAVAVTIDAWREKIYQAAPKQGDRQSVEIHATIHVEKNTQKKIIVGEAGSRIKQIGIEARKEIAKFLDCKVHLYLFVRVDENWSQTVHGLKEMGYEG